LGNYAYYKTYNAYDYDSDSSYLGNIDILITVWFFGYVQYSLALFEETDHRLFVQIHKNTHFMLISYLEERMKNLDRTK
jgi:hypothetical protein